MNEPHVNVWRFGSCVRCGAPDAWVIVAVPRVATGEQFPQFGVCEVCGHKVDLSDMPPFLPAERRAMRQQIARRSSSHER
jgi:hypothetical protein